MGIDDWAIVMDD